jgi:hypothetical protein
VGKEFELFDDLIIGRDMQLFLTHVLVQPLVVLKDLLKAETSLGLALVDARTCFTDCIAEGWAPDVDAFVGQISRLPCGEADLGGRG